MPQGQQGQALAHVLLVFGVDIQLLPQIGDGAEERVFIRVRRLLLGLTDQGIVAADHRKPGAKARQLHHKEGKLLAPERTPVGDQRLQRLRIVGGGAFNLVVALALIPEHALHPEGCGLFHHMLVKGPRGHLRVGKLRDITQVDQSAHLRKEGADLLRAGRPGHNELREGIPGGVAPVVQLALSRLRRKLLKAFALKPRLEIRDLLRADRSCVILAHPGRGPGAAPVEADDAHGNAQLPPKRFGKIVCRGRKIIQILPVCLPPDPDLSVIEIPLLSVIGDLGHIEKADGGVFAFRALRRKMLLVPHEKFHIRLAAREKNVADCHILQRDVLILSPDLQCSRFLCLQRPDPDGPAAFCIGFGLGLLSLHRHLDSFSRPGFSPDGDDLSPLENHMLLKQTCRLHANAPFLFIAPRSDSGFPGLPPPACPARRAGSSDDGNPAAR